MKNGKLFSVLRCGLLWALALTVPMSAAASTVGSSAVSGLNEAREEESVFTFENDATSVTVQIEDNKIYILDFGFNSYSGSRYITEKDEIPLMSTISGEAINWQFTSSEVDETEGKKVTFNFDNGDGRYLMHSVFEIKPGSGPVEYSCTIDNKTQATASFDAAVAQTTNLDFVSDAETSVWCYARMKHGNAGENWNTPIRDTKIIAGTDASYNVSNSYWENVGDLPYLMFDMGDHGFYYGFMWSFGQMNVKSEDGTSINLTAGNPITADTAIAEAGYSFTVPGMFIGAYQGDTDDGSNVMKRWFWDYKVVDNLRDNADEPQIELDWSPMGLENGNNRWLSSFTNDDSWGPYIDQYGLDGVGFEVLKYDYDWTTSAPCQQNLTAEESWSPDYSKLPDGMNAYSIIKNYSEKVNFALYMCNSYQHANLVVHAGQESQINALKERFSPDANGEYGYDYWRSDFWVEHPFNFGFHQGLLNVLDEMIDWSKTQDHVFRYEHCASGGTLKDFTTLERMTFMTTEDSTVPINYRMALYTNSYMINPTQLKSDLNFDQGPKNTTYYNYLMRSSMLGACMVAGTYNNWQREGMIDTCMSHWKLYKEKQRPILRGGNVYHILDMPTSNLNSAGSVNTYDDWDGIEYYNDDIDKGSVFLFAENTLSPEAKTIVLKGLDEDKLYTLNFQERTELNCTKTGKELMTDGIRVTGMSGNYASEIIWVEADKTQSVSKARFITALHKAEAIDTAAYGTEAVWQFAKALDNAYEVYENSASTSYDYWYANTLLTKAVNALESTEDPEYADEGVMVADISDKVVSIGELNKDNQATKIKLVEIAEKLVAAGVEKFGDSFVIPEAEKLANLRAAYDELNSGMYGDVTGDEKLDSADALKVLQYTVGKSTLDEKQLKLGDVNADGVVDSADSLAILQKIVGKLQAFKVEE